MQQRRLANWRRTLPAIIVATQAQRNANLWHAFPTIVVASKAQGHLDARQALRTVVVATPFANAIRHRTTENPAARLTCE